MKKVFLFIVLLPLFSIAQITGTTKRQITFDVGTDGKTTLKIPSGDTVDIIDANNYFFTILYNGNKTVVNRNKIDFDQTKLNELLKIKTDNELSEGKLTLKDIEAQKITDNTRIADNYKYEIDHIRYCTGKYRNEIMTGYVFSFVGMASMSAPLYIKTKTNEDADNVKLVGGIGFGISLVGLIIIIDSNKWMKRINVGPDGIGLRYRF